MASTAMAMYVTDENGDVFYPIGHTGAIYDANGELLSNVLDGTVNGVSSLPRKLLPPNARIVYCDGDHDELKLQAAIDELAEAGGGVVYPVGECVLTLDNAQKNGAPIVPAMTFVALNIKSGITIDGTYCSGVILQPKAIQVAQYVFLVQNANTVLRNIKFTEAELEDYPLGRTTSPAILYGSQCRIENCEFTNIYTRIGAGPTGDGFNLTNGSIIRSVRFVDGYVRGFTTSSRWIFVKDSYISDVEFKGFTTLPGSYAAYFANIINCTVDNMRITDSEIPKDRLQISSCSLNNLDINNTSIYGVNVGSCEGRSLKLSGISTNSVIIHGSNLADTIIDTLAAAKASVNIEISTSYIDGLVMKNCTPVTGSSFIKATAATLLNCMFSIDVGDEAEEFVLIEGNKGTIFKNNITNYTNIGTFDDTCIVEGNTTGTFIKGVVTVTSDNASGFIEGSRLTATASNGDVEDANVESLYQPYYAWQKSADGETWEDVGNNATYTLVGDEGYIRCVLTPFPKTYSYYIPYCGAVYSDAYAVTATTGGIDLIKHGF